MNIYNYKGNKIDLGVKTDKTLTISGEPADAKTVGDMFDELDVSVVEPKYDDIPELYITGTTPTSKDEGKVPVAVSYRSRTLSFDEYATLKVQGDTSVHFPKKNFTINFFSDATCKTKSKHDFKNWGKQNKFVLKANWIDITHARNVVSARLWTDVVKSRSNYSSLPASMLNSPNLAVIDGFVVKVYTNGVYQGRYTLNMPKDKWMFNMDDESDSNAALCSEGFKCLFKDEQQIAIDGTDWTDEVHEDNVPASVVSKFNTFYNFVALSTDADFVAGITNYADVLSFIDYYLFGYVDCGFDGFGKNQMILFYDNGPFIASVYDLDTTWGLYWDGASLLPYDYAENEYITKHNLYVRLKKLFPTLVKNRYEELRNGPLSADNIIHRFEEFCDIMPKELVEEDYATTTANGAFVNIPSKNLTSLVQVRNYVAKRLNYLDTVMLDMYQPNTFSIIGDSYSTYAGYTNTGFRVGYDVYYPANGELTSVEQTWWKLLEQQTSLTLLTNESYSGSCICYDGYGDGTSDQGNNDTSFISRRHRTGYPEFLLIFGGTNDAWVPASLGSYKYSDWTEADKSYFRPALAYLIDYYQKNFPLTTIVFVKNDVFNSDYSTSIDTICQHYGITEIQLSNISKYSNTGHPSVAGMEQIASQIKTALNL